MYAIVDIETTGSFASANGITEISIYIHDGTKITQHFQSLINPLSPIPPYISKLTGISDDMLVGQPEFKDLAPEIFELLKDRIFVAHSVNFDYSFLKSALNGAGFELNSKKLCTVRLSRAVFPGLSSYSLGNICGYLKINIENRHRADGDARATVSLFEKILQNDTENHVSKALKRNSKEQSLPMNLPASAIEELPEYTGVYYFMDQKGKVIYVGKAINIKGRVKSHFFNNTSTKQKQEFLSKVYSIQHKKCASELTALILESSEIEKYWPPLNRAQKVFKPAFGLYSYYDEKGFLRTGIGKLKKNVRALETFSSLQESYSMLRKWIHDHELCPRLSGLTTLETECPGIEKGTCKGACIGNESVQSYNQRAENALIMFKSEQSFVISEHDINSEEISVVLVEKGRFIGTGTVKQGADLKTYSSFAGSVNRIKENYFIRKLIFSYIRENPQNLVFYSKDEEKCELEFNTQINSNVLRLF